MKWKLVFGLVLAGIVLGNVLFWNFKVKSQYDSGFAEGSTSGYNSGFEVGYNEGNESGYQAGFNRGNNLGYEAGYSGGRQNGFADGYLLGYSDGNNSGYNLGFYQGNFSGFANGYLQGVTDGAGTGYNIRNPTYAEMLSFIASDRTDENEYSDNYTCLHFTADVTNNAFNAGYRCGYVYVEFPIYAHAIVCFNTTDHGLVFIEPQDDRITVLTIGKPYWNRAHYDPPGYNDTVLAFVIIW